MILKIRKFISMKYTKIRKFILKNPLKIRKFGCLSCSSSPKWTRKQVQYFCYCSVLHNIIIEYIRLIENGNNIFCGILRIGIFHKIENAYVERQVFREVGA